MGIAFSFLWPWVPSRGRERERAMELRKRPRPRRLDPDFVSSPPREQLRKRARKEAPPAKRPREEVEGKQQQQPPPPRKRPRCAGRGIGSPVSGFHPVMCVCARQAAPPLPPPPRVSFRPRHPFAWYEPDMWTEIAKHLCGTELVRLSLTCRWFRRLIADDSIWRYAFLQDLDLSAAFPCPPRRLRRSWRALYAAAFDGSHGFRPKEKLLDWWRIGGLVLDSPFVLLTGNLPLPGRHWLVRHATDVRLSLEMMGVCVLTNARPGIWIADMLLVRCPVCNLNTCEGTMQVLDVRHSELFLDQAYWDGTLKYEKLGDHFLDGPATTALCAMFNMTRLASPPAVCILDTKSWIRERQNLLPRVHGNPYAAAVNSNLKPNNGLRSKFEAIRDTRDGKIVSIRISQLIR